jgi:N-acetylglutamate synthase-like GNAT family acetyltransferase
MIRAAVDTDSEAIFGLLEQLAHTYAPDRSAFDIAFPSLVSDENAILLVAVKSDVVVGYALGIVSLLLYTNGRSAQLQELVVDDGSRSEGIGGALVRAMEDECIARDVRQLTVASRRAAGFYEARGYSTTADYLKRTF